jgi:drug/metabolite transporter (DMT)-like permease
MAPIVAPCAWQVQRCNSSRKVRTAGPGPALRETSVVFAVLIGWILLGEPFGRRRIVAAILVGFGIAIMHLAG